MLIIPCVMIVARPCWASRSDLYWRAGARSTAGDIKPKLIKLDASAYANPVLAVAARKRHQSGQAQKEQVCGKPCERSRVRGQRKTAAQLTPDLLGDLLHSRHDRRQRQTLSPSETGFYHRLPLAV